MIRKTYITITETGSSQREGPWDAVRETEVVNDGKDVILRWSGKTIRFEYNDLASAREQG